MRRRTVLAGLSAVVLAVISTAPASAIGWRWHRQFSVNGETGNGSGHTHRCAASRFGVWDWHGVIHERGGGALTVRWTETISRDGRYHWLQWTYVNDTAWRGLPASQRNAIRRAVMRGLYRRVKVAWYNFGPRETLEYRDRGGAILSEQRWQPTGGC